jgi:hypothetical protein
MQPQNSKNYGQKWLNGLDAELLAQATKNQRPRGMPSLGMIKTEMTRLGLPETDADYIHDIWLMNGYTMRTGKPIKDWKAAIRIWQSLGYLPSQKKTPKSGPTDTDRAQAAIDRMREGR